MTITNEDIDNAIAALTAVAEDDREPERYRESYRQSLEALKIARNRPEETPAFTTSYADRFAIPMLTTRKLLLEQHCLMAQAREVEEQIRAVREWQLAHVGLLTPFPGGPAELPRPAVDALIDTVLDGEPQVDFNHPMFRGGMA